MIMKEFTAHLTYQVTEVVKIQANDEDSATDYIADNFSELVGSGYVLDSDTSDGEYNNIEEVKK